MKLVFDIETNGLLEEVTKIFSIVAEDLDTQKVYSFTPDNIDDGVKLLSKADLLVGHNIQGFDIPVIEKLYDIEIKAELFDTLIVSRLIYSNLFDKDLDFKKIPSRLFGKHSLEAWGHRLGQHKGEYLNINGFDKWTPEMQEYCENDNKITLQLYKHLQNKRYSSQAIELEHQFAHWIRKQERLGVNFDVNEAKKLQKELLKKVVKIDKELRKSFPEKTIKRISEKTNKPLKDKIEIFNPSSREQISSRLIEKYNWKPLLFTPTGKPEINERILKQLKYPEAKLLAEHFMLQKRLGQIADGEQGYLKIEKKGKVYGKIITNGAITGRCTHHSPNLGQTTSANLPYGKEIRSLFYAPNSMVMCGIDFSNLELRITGHYLSPLDGGSFINKLLEKDLHSENQKALGLSSRTDSKKFIFSYIYGAGDKKIGEIISKDAGEVKRIRKNLEKNIPALVSLKDNVVNAVRTKGFLRGLDGRQLTPRGEHSSLNTLIQSGGSIVVKQGTIIMNQLLEDAGFIWGKDYGMVLHIHDEMQFIVAEDKLKQFKEISKQIFKLTQDKLKLRVPLDGELKVGKNWSETH